MYLICCTLYTSSSCLPTRTLSNIQSWWNTSLRDKVHNFHREKPKAAQVPKDAVKTIRFASLENWGARIRHGGAGRSCPGPDWGLTNTWPCAPGSQHHCYIASGVRLGAETLIQWIERGATRETRESVSLSLLTLTWLEPLIISSVPSLLWLRVWCQEADDGAQEIAWPSPAQPLMINEQLPLPSLV